MNKIFSKTVKKTMLWSVILAIVLAASIVVCAIFGFNKNITLKDSKTLTVSSNDYQYNQALKAGTVKEECEALFGKLDAEYSAVGEMSGAVNEIVFVFDKDVDLTAVEEALEAHFNSGKWEDADVSVSVSVEKASAVVAKGYILRAAIACVVFAILAFVYVALRYKLCAGIVTAVATLLGMLMTGSVIVLTRVCVTTSVAYVIAIAGFITAVMTLFTVNKLRANATAEGSEEDKVVYSIAWKEAVMIGAALAVAMLLVGILGRTAAAWFAASALIGIAVSLLISLVYAPALYLTVKTALDKKPARDAYVGAKKTSTKAKKMFAPVAKKEEEAEASVEEAVEETVEETTEEAVEETTEETVEEVEEETAEEVVEETAEESVEEATEETAEETAEEVAEAPVEETAEEEKTEE